MTEGILPQLGLGGAAIGIFALCAGYVMLRGLARMLAAVLMLCGSAWIGFIVWQKAPGWAIAWTGAPPSWITTGLPAFAFIGSFIVFREVTGFVMRPVSRSGNGAPRSWPKRLLLMGFALVPTSAFWLTGATILHHAGSIAELKFSSETMEDSAGGSSAGALLRELRPAIAAAVPAGLLAKLDPLTDPARMSMAKWILSGSPEHDPATGEPAPVAIAVDEKNLNKLARDGRFSTLLHHPELKKAAESPEIRKRLRGAPHRQ
jgi:hypothetical protein